MTTKRACSLCGGPLGKSNHIGICSRTAACRRAAVLRHRAEYLRRRAEYRRRRRSGESAAPSCLAGGRGDWPREVRPAAVLHGVTIAISDILDELERLLALARRATEKLGCAQEGGDPT